MKKYRILDVLDKLNVKDFQIIGDPGLEFSAPVTIWEGKKGCISYCEKDRVGDQIKVLNKTQASVVLTDGNLNDIDEDKIVKNKCIVFVDHPREIFISLLHVCFPYNIERGKRHPSSVIDEGADIHPTASIAAQCVIGKCKIGENSVVRPNTIIFDDVKIGKNVIIGPDCVIGYDGFSYDITDHTNYVKYLHYGGVFIDDDVEIFSKVNIVRGTIDDTVIQKGVKIGNYTNIGHNVIVGKYTRISAAALIGGNTTIKEDVFIGINASVRNGIIIGENAYVAMDSNVVKDVQKGTLVMGNPAKAKDKSLFKSKEIPRFN